MSSMDAALECVLKAERATRRHRARPAGQDCTKASLHTEGQAVGIIARPAGDTDSVHRNPYIRAEQFAPLALAWR